MRQIYQQSFFMSYERIAPNTFIAKYGKKQMTFAGEFSLDEMFIWFFTQMLITKMTRHRYA